MKKTIILTAVVLLTPLLSPHSLASSFKFGISGNYYSVTDSVYREMYGRGNVLVSGFLGMEMANCCEIRAEWIYFRDKGKMSLSEEDIIFTLTTPIIVGLRAKIIGQDAYGIYFGGGIDFYSYREVVPPRFENFTDKKTGFHFEAGSLIRVFHRIHIDLNIRYNKLNVEPLGESLELGGVRAGIGLEYQF